MDPQTVGIIAQELKLIENACCPIEYFVYTENANNYGIKYELLIMPMIKSIQQLSAQNKLLSDRLDVLEAV